MKPFLCGCLLDASLEELIKALNHTGLTLLEWRLDAFLTTHSMEETLGALNLLRGTRRLPVLATNRPTREGGLFAGTEDARLGILAKAVEAGADWVDLEMDVTTETLAHFESFGPRVLLSHHDFSGTPDEKRLREWVGAMAMRGPQAIKIVTHAHSPEDNLRVLGLIPWTRREFDRALIAFCMGPLGRWSRLACLLLGSPWTYVQLPGQTAAASGQLSPDELKELWRFFSSHENGAG